MGYIKIKNLNIIKKMFGNKKIIKEICNGITVYDDTTQTYSVSGTIPVNSQLGIAQYSTDDGATWINVPNENGRFVISNITQIKFRIRGDITTYYGTSIQSTTLDIDDSVLPYKDEYSSYANDVLTQNVSDVVISTFEVLERWHTVFTGTAYMTKSSSTSSYTISDWKPSMYYPITSTDYMRVTAKLQQSTNNGTSWTTIATFTGKSGNCVYNQSALSPIQYLFMQLSGFQSQVRSKSGTKTTIYRWSITKVEQLYLGHNVTVNKGNLQGYTPVDGDFQYSTDNGATWINIPSISGTSYILGIENIKIRCKSSNSDFDTFFGDSLLGLYAESFGGTPYGESDNLTLTGDITIYYNAELA